VSKLDSHSAALRLRFYYV